MMPVHPEGELELPQKDPLAAAIEVETFAGKVYVEWDSTAAVTPIGQLPYFIEFLKIGNRFTPWVDECPLFYKSNNAPTKINVLGSLFLSILSGHNRYVHLTALRGDTVNTKLLGMTKVVSDSSAIRALQRMDEEDALAWAESHLYSCYEPLLKFPWILDVDVTIKPLYGRQEGAVIGFNPHKPGRPSHTFHTYMMANTRIILKVEVRPGNETHSSHSMPGLMDLLNKLPVDSKPKFVRGDCDWGNDAVMTELEEAGYDYLFKLKRTERVKELISKLHGESGWTRFDDHWEVKESILKLAGWKKERRVVVIRRRSPKNDKKAVEHKVGEQMELELLDGPEDIRQYEYSVLVTTLIDEPISIVQHYRDRADSENIFDETKNQWGWGGFVTHKLITSRIMAAMVALVYNWWNLFVRLAIPEQHHEAITSRPLLLTSVGRLTETARQRKITITSTHGEVSKIRNAYARVTSFLQEVKAIAPQLTDSDRWRLIVVKAMEVFLNRGPPGVPALPA
jgi:hypothetical protein